MSRKNLRLTLQQVSDFCGTRGDRIPVSTLARIESGKLDPGIRRLNLLFQLYRVPGHLFADLVELEELAIDAPTRRDLDALLKEGTEHWKEGRIGEGLAYLMALRQHSATGAESESLRQQATLMFAIAARNLGKYQLARHIVDDLLLENVDDSLLTRALVLAASIWRGLGAPEVALALINRASSRIGDARTLDAAYVFHQEAKLQLERGDPAAAGERLDRALKIYRRLRDSYSEARARILKVGVVEAASGAEAAIPTARAALRFASKHDKKWVAIHARIELGRLLVAAGKFETGLESLLKALSEAVLIEDRNAEFFARHRLWKAYEQAGDTERAEFEFSAAANCMQRLDEASAEADEIRRRLQKKGEAS